MTETEKTETHAESTRCGILAVVGCANVGKSTLVNALIGEKISIVSSVAQTTRHLVRGILSETRGQLVFLDTPGVHKASSDLGRLMNRTARSGAAGADMAVLVFDASCPPRMEDDGWLRRISREELPVILVLNKVDANPLYEDRYRTLAASILPDAPLIWHRISACSGEGLEGLKDTLFKAVPVGPLLFPEEVVSDFPVKLALADLIREKLFERLRQEIPHAVAVRVDDVMDTTENDWCVSATIFVQKHSQKVIVIGHKGRMLRSVKRAAEREIESEYEKATHLDLWVKVSPKWDRNFFLLKQLGHAQ